MQHVYVKQKAAISLNTGCYADGTIFVFDLKESKTKDNAVIKEFRKVLAVMEKTPKNIQKLRDVAQKVLNGAIPKSVLLKMQTSNATLAIPPKKVKTIYLM